MQNFSKRTVQNHYDYMWNVHRKHTKQRVCVCVLVFIYRWGLKPEYTQPHGDLCHGGDLN